MYFNLFRVIFFALFISTASAQEFRDESVLGGLVEIKVPQDFRLMPDEERNIKYPMRDSPKVVFTNLEGNTDIAINLKDNKIPPDQIEALRQALSKSMHNLYPSSTWYKDTVYSINGRKFSYLELTTPAIDIKIRNHMLATSADGVLLFVSVNMPEQKAASLAPTVAKIIESVHVTRP